MSGNRPAISGLHAPKRPVYQYAKKVSLKIFLLTGQRALDALGGGGMGRQIIQGVLTAPGFAGTGFLTAIVFKTRKDLSKVPG